MDFSHVFDRTRWRRRFQSEGGALREAQAEDRGRDATVDEVGVPHDNVGFSGQPIISPGGNGHGTGDPNSPGWAGWGSH